MNFPFVWSPGRICGDASVEYWSHPGAPAAARDLLPDAKLIIVLRDPVERAWSDYRMFRRSGIEQEDFVCTIERAVRWLSESDARSVCASALRNSFNPLRYVRCGMYAELLEIWRRHYTESQILVLISEDFFSNPQDETNKVWHFLGLSPVELNRVPRERISGEGEPVPPLARELLENFYAPMKTKLEEALGRSLPWF